MTQKAAAAAFCVSPATAHRWWHRRLEAGARVARKLAARPLEPSAPLPSAARASSQERICECRRQHRLGTTAGRRRHRPPHSTVWKVLARHGLSRRQGRREPANRYEWPCPGDLLHMDVSRYARFERPGHALTGDRSQRSRMDDSRAGRLRLLPTRSSTITPAWPTSSCTPTRRHRPSPALSSGHSLLRLPRDQHQAADDRQRFGLPAKPLAARAVRHRSIKSPDTQPYRPRTNGKVERFHQTMAREWAYGMAYRSHRIEQGPATLAAPLQRAQAPQLTRRPAADQPRSQRPWAGQLVASDTTS